MEGFSLTFFLFFSAGQQNREISLLCTKWDFHILSPLLRLPSSQSFAFWPHNLSKTFDLGVWQGRLRRMGLHFTKKNILVQLQTTHLSSYGKGKPFQNSAEIDIENHSSTKSQLNFSSLKIFCEYEGESWLKKRVKDNLLTAIEWIQLQTEVHQRPQSEQP